MPEKPISTSLQWVVSVSAFGVKPAYMLGSFVLILWLRRQSAPDLRALRWAMIWFLVGEGLCALNYLLFNEESFLVEYLHMFGMVMAFGFTTYALAEGLDLRVIHFSDPAKNCAALPLCGPCIKHTATTCGGRRALLLLAIVGVLISLIPLTVHFQVESYNSRILGTLYNYSHPVIFQIYEVRTAPLTALVFFLAAAGMLGLAKDPPLSWAKVLVAAGAGFLGFSFFRLVLFHAFRGNLTWFVAWEEFTELIYVAGAAAVLWIFRGRLLERTPAENRDN